MQFSLMNKLFWFLFSLSLFFVSCAKTDDVVLPNNFSGNWYNSESSSVTGVSTYPVAIEAVNQPEILFAYLYGFHTKISAITTNNNFEIPQQIIEGNSVSGSGQMINSTHINMVYIVDNGLFRDSVVATLVK